MLGAVRNHNRQARWSFNNLSLTVDVCLFAGAEIKFRRSFFSSFQCTWNLTVTNLLPTTNDSKSFSSAWKYVFVWLLSWYNTCIHCTFSLWRYTQIYSNQNQVSFNQRKRYIQTSCNFHESAALKSWIECQFQFHLVTCSLHLIKWTWLPIGDKDTAKCLNFKNQDNNKIYFGECKKSSPCTHNMNKPARFEMRESKI